MTNSFEVTREKFFDTQELLAIMKTTERKAKSDTKANRITWISRWMLVHLAFYSGLRVAEIADLKIQDLNLKCKQPYLKVNNGKGGKSRIVYIDQRLTDHLQGYTKGRRKIEYLFTNTFGSKGKKQRYSTTTLHRSFKKAIKSSGLRMNLTIHSARHTYATNLLDKCKNIRFVQKQLGHSSLNITAVYADIIPEKNGQLANLIID